MRRRDFLTAGAAMAGLITARAGRVPGQTQQSRAAVVIGVDRAGNLAKLSAAASGARQVARWLQFEGFEVKQFIDDAAPVTIDSLFDAIKALVDRGTLEQLVIYFAGHGFLNGNTEYWMLSQAPGNSNEAINLLETTILAYDSSIPNVVFISDACRSTPSSLGINRVGGSTIFPNPGRSPTTDTEIDQFFATRPGSAAFELPANERVPLFNGIYTATLLEAFDKPNPEMIKTIDGVSFVSNRSLSEFLKREVPRRILATSPKLNQVPQGRIQSSDTVYIGRVSTPPQLLSTVTPSVKPSIADVAGDEVERLVFGEQFSPMLNEGWEARIPDEEELGRRRLADETGFTATIDQIRSVSGPEQFESQSGCIVAGAPVTRAVGSLGMRVDLLQAGGSQPGILRFWHSQAPGGSVAVRFGDGSGTVIAALPGYISNIVVDRGGVVSVSYVPSENTERWPDYQQERHRLERLRATVATAFRFGTFWIEGGREERERRAGELADRIRILKAIDPALGLYAAYAYFEANLVEKVRSVQAYMHDDLQIDLFDVAMLTGKLADKFPLQPEDQIPFCPMLSQGWNLLRVRNVRLPAAVEAARDHLRAALWTTFSPPGMDVILPEMDRGTLQ